MVLETVEGPEDLKKLPVGDLGSLAEEIRSLIIEAVNANGGHMASNLGVVELTIVLHRLFNSPKDRIILDTSHQCYAHKILTGRAKEFRKIRTSGGYSGFFEPRESPHDAMVIGHAGCGPSLSLGLAIGEKAKGGSGYTVCVIGDGALTTGLAYEGLSNIIAQNPRNMMVILNDNGMSISANVGWLAKWRDRWLSRLRNELELDTDFQTFERVSETLAQKLPLGELALSLGKGIKATVQKAIIPDIGSFWDEMGFNYIGPVDGHNIEELLEVIPRARFYSDKVPFIHILTNKGQGFGPAEQDPVSYHQPGTPTGTTYSQVFCDLLAELMTTDPRIVAISAAMLEGTGLAALKPKFPDRVFDVGICEQHAVSMAAGMARAGLRPVVCIYSTFLQRAFDQIIHDVCLNDLPVVFGVDRAGIVGQDGKTHQGLYDLAYMRIPPNMILSVPRDENEMRHLLYTALRQDHPFAIRYPRGEIQGVELEALREIPIGTAEVLREGGTWEPVPGSGPQFSLCLCGVGHLVGVALKASGEIASQGIQAQVVNVRFVKPIDPALVEELDKFTDVIVLEEASSVGGVAAAIMEGIAQLGWPGPRVHQLSVGDIFLEHGDRAELRQTLGLDHKGVIDWMRKGGGKWKA